MTVLVVEAAGLGVCVVVPGNSMTGVGISLVPIIAIGDDVSLIGKASLVAGVTDASC